MTRRGSAYSVFMHKRLVASLGLPVATLFFALAACGHKQPPPPQEPPVTETLPDAGADDAVDAAPGGSLFDRIGGKAVLAQIVDTFVKNIETDGRVSHAFAKTRGPRMQHFHDMLVEQLCELTGGPCTYQGKDMKNAHKGMHLTDKQFDAIVEDLQLALAELKIGEREQTELVNVLNPMKEDIIGEKHGK